ncbi:hypothetical protein ACN469_36025 [Corallococcus terminator]
MPEAAPPKSPVFSLLHGLPPVEDKPEESFAQLQAQADVVAHRPSVQHCQVRTCELTLVETETCAPLEARAATLEMVDGKTFKTDIDRKGHVVLDNVDVPLDAREVGLYVIPHEDGTETLEVEVRRTLEAEAEVEAEPVVEEEPEVAPPWLPFGDVSDD